ncbi:hypothetical protein COB57_03635 [Candidatus Peregrinibacteria bacterium]|nr:MAG: hypothetical protein COB57_03635 [Candidatus Peregrinibacteria bacterium]
MFNFQSLFSQSPSIKRKKRSEIILKNKNIPFIDKLPVITDDDQKTKLRSKSDIAKRAISLHIVALKGEDLEQTIIDKLINIFNAADFFTPEEKMFIKKDAPSQQQKINFIWRYECCWVMLWALGYIDKLEFPDKICDVTTLVTIIKNSGSYENFLNKAQPKTIHEILNEADLIYRYNWACVNSRIKNQTPPALLDPGVVLERHHALNWIIHSMDQEWDDISTDT